MVCAGGRWPSALLGQAGDGKTETSAWWGRLPWRDMGNWGRQAPCGLPGVQGNVSGEGAGGWLLGLAQGSDWSPQWDADTISVVL